MLLSGEIAEGGQRAPARPCLRRAHVATLVLPVLLGYAQTPYRAAEGNIEFALTGDSIISRPLSAYVEPEFTAMVEAIRGADLAFTNLEIALQTVDKLTPMVSDRESYMFADPIIAEELAWAGFDAVSRANNHALDYGWDGMRATSRALDAASVAHAGVGENLALADEATYVQTANGRVALISTASSFDTFHPARPQRTDIRATPGLNPIRYQRTTTLPADEFEALKKIARDLGQRVDDESHRARLRRGDVRIGRRGGSSDHRRPG